MSQGVTGQGHIYLKLQGQVVSSMLMIHTENDTRVTAILNVKTVLVPNCWHACLPTCLVGYILNKFVKKSPFCRMGIDSSASVSHDHL